MRSMPLRSVSICWARIGKKSKYASQNDVATSEPEHGGGDHAGAESVLLSPRPMAINDSPIAMITISP